MTAKTAAGSLNLSTGKVTWKTRKSAKPKGFPITGETVIAAAQEAAKPAAKKATRKAAPVTTRQMDKTPERELLWEVYCYVVENWAVDYAELDKALDMEKSDIRRLAQKLARAGLLTAEHVNSERTITWQSFHDVLNERPAKGTGRNKKGEWIAARADFDQAFPEGTVKEPTKPAAGPKNAGTGPRYTQKQIEAGLKARREGQNWKQVAATVGVKSPFHFSKIVRQWDPSL